MAEMAEWRKDLGTLTLLSDITVLFESEDSGVAEGLPRRGAGGVCVLWRACCVGVLGRAVGVAVLGRAGGVGVGVLWRVSLVLVLCEVVDVEELGVAVLTCGLPVLNVAVLSKLLLEETPTWNTISVQKQYF